jgi:hypothetical protein
MLKREKINKNWRAGIFIVIAILSFAPAASPSRLPDTLRFGGVSYIKRIEKLYHNKARLILINEKQQPAYVMAELFDKHVSFLNQAGKVVKTDSFPQSPSFTYSKTGKWLYLWGRKNYANYFYRLYGPGGKVSFEKVMPSSGAEPSTGIPLEDPSEFIKLIAADGIMALVDTAGDILYSAKPMSDSAQANLLFDSDLNGNAIFAVASPGEYTEFISYNGHLVEQRRAMLDLGDAISISSAHDGRFALVDFFDASGGWPLVVISSTGQKLFQISFPKASKLSEDDQYLGVGRGNTEIQLIKTDAWETIVRIDSTSLAPWPYSGAWKSIDFSDDNRFMLALSEGVLLFIDVQKREWQAIDFPYSFWQARLVNGSTDLYIIGDYGWVLYKMLR